eukprot:s2564_g13.t1
MVACPWSYGYAALGHRTVYSRQLSPPMPFGVGSGLPPAAIDAEAIQVQRYAEEHPNEDLDPPQLSEAGPQDAVEVPKPVEMDVQSAGKYELEFEDDEWLVLDELPADASFDLKNAIKELSYPYGPSEPDVSDDQLRHLDRLAWQIKWSCRDLQSLVYCWILTAFLVIQKFFQHALVLPGQRDGSLLWYRDITDFLKSNLDMVEYTPYPCVLSTKDGSCAVMIHVDDMLIVGCRSFVLGKFMDVMRSKYEISMEVLEKPGDEVTFLKRTHLLHEDGSHTNPADIATNRMTASCMRSLMSLLGLFNMSSNMIEGADDPGRVFTKHPNVRALISALSLLQLQGCDASINASINFDDNSWMMFFTLILGFLMLLPFAFSWFSARATANMSFEHQQDDAGQAEQMPVHAEPAPEPVPLWGGVNLQNIPRDDTEEDVPMPDEEWSPEALVVFMFERCQRRHDAAQTSERRVLYMQGLAVLRAIMRDLRQATGDDRLRVSQMILDMPDISKDETSPLHGASMAQRDETIRESGEAHAWVARNFIEGDGPERERERERERETERERERERESMQQERRAVAHQMNKWRPPHNAWSATFRVRCVK